MNSAGSPKKQKSYLPAFDFIPAEGETAEIAAGVHWLRMPLSFELSHINLWLLQGPGGCSIIDSGFNTPQSAAIWDRVLSEKTGNSADKIFITHFHPDHIGLAGYLNKKTGAPILMTAGEQNVITQLTETGSEEKLQDLYTPYYRSAGVPQELMLQMLEKRKLFKKIISALPDAITTVSLGDTVTLGGKNWQLIGGGGHTPEHACLYNADDKIFIAGDIVLPDITPNISLFPGQGDRHDPLQDYYDTLTNVKENVPDNVIVLPSHGVPFRGLHKRIDEIILHHQDRCDKIRTICKTPKTAHDVMEQLFAHRKLSVSDLFFALSETIAHLMHDVYVGKIILTQQDSVDIYQSA